MPDLKVFPIVDGTPRLKADVEMLLNANKTFASGPVFVSGQDRAAQDVVRGVLTQIGTNPLTPRFGTNLDSFLNAPRVNDVASQISAEIRFVLAYLAKFNAGEDDAERIETLVSLAATEQTGTIDLKMTVRTAAGQNIVISR